MKITLEFNNAEKFFTELPKFAELIKYASQYATFDHIDTDKVVEAILQSTNPPINEDRVPVEQPLPETEKAISDAVKSAATSQDAQDEDEAPKPKKSTPKKEKAKDAQEAKPEEIKKTSQPKDTDVRKVLNQLIKGGKRDSVAEILKSFGAANFTGLDQKHYAEAIEKAEAILQEG